MSIITVVLLWSNHGCLNHGLQGGLSIQRAWSCWPRLPFTKIIDPFWILHSESRLVVIHKHFIKSFHKTVLKYHRRYKKPTYMTGNLLHWYTDHTIDVNWKPCFRDVLILIKILLLFVNVPWFSDLLLLRKEAKITHHSVQVWIPFP